jgi:ppGpp synthetase/RelA/SpoT-type nucleotidyltranferase
MQNETLHMEYLELSAKLSRLQGLLTAQLNQLVEAAGLTLGLPIESRVKTWSSIGEKLERKGIQPEKLSDLSDLLGVRITFLFQRDLDAFCAPHIDYQTLNSDINPNTILYIYLPLGKRSLHSKGLRNIKSRSRSELSHSISGQQYHTNSNTNKRTVCPFHCAALSIEHQPY